MAVFLVRIAALLPEQSGRIAPKGERPFGPGREDDGSDRQRGESVPKFFDDLGAGDAGRAAASLWRVSAGNFPGWVRAHVGDFGDSYIDSDRAYDSTQAAVAESICDG